MRFVQQAITRENYKKVLKPLLTAGPGPAFLVNLSVDVDCLDLMRLARETNALYIDTVIEPWPGFYYNPKLGSAARSNYVMRESLLDAQAQDGRRPDGRVLLWCQPRHGVVVREAGAAQHRLLTSRLPTTCQSRATAGPS